MIPDTGVLGVPVCTVEVGEVNDCLTESDQTLRLSPEQDEARFLVALGGAPIPLCLMSGPC